MFKHYMNQGLYHQSQRATTANILLILSGGAIGLITLDTKLKGPDDISAAVSLFVLGLFGIVWSRKYHERYAYYLQRAGGYRDALNRALSTNIDMKAIRVRITQQHRNIGSCTGCKCGGFGQPCM